MEFYLVIIRISHPSGKLVVVRSLPGEVPLDPSQWVAYPGEKFLNLPKSNTSKLVSYALFLYQVQPLPCTKPP